MLHVIKEREPVLKLPLLKIISSKFSNPELTNLLGSFIRCDI